METRHEIARVSTLSLDKTHVRHCSKLPAKSEESSSENNNVLETSDSDDSPSWDDEEDCVPPGTPTYLAKDSHSLTFQWEQCKPSPGLTGGTYSVQMQAIEAEWLSMGSCLDSESWQTVYSGLECWTKVKRLKPGRYYAIRIRCDWHFHHKIVSVVSSIAVLHTTVTIPAVMQPPSLIGLQHSSMKLNWRDPVEDGGAEITMFRLQLKPSTSTSSEEEFSDVYIGPERSFTVTKLNPFTKYITRVKAINEVGEGPWSLCSCFTTKVRAPEAPGNLRGRLLTPTLILLEWDLLQCQSRNPVSYELEMENFQTGHCSYFDVGCSSSHELRDLVCDIKYQFRVRGLNEAGVGEWSHRISLQSIAVPPSPPSCPILISCSQTDAAFAWHPPLESGGHPVQCYKVELLQIGFHHSCMAANLTQNWSEIYEGAPCECKVSTLTCGCDYHIRVRAKSEAGWSVPSITRQFRTGTGVPDISGVPSAIDRKSHSMKVHWTIPNHNGGARIDYFRLESCPVNELKLKNDNLELEPFKEVYRGKRNQVEVLGLDPGLVYALRVQSVNVIGKSEWSEIGYETTKGAPPSAPESLDVVAKDSSSVHIKWSKPCSHGSAILGYSVTLNQAQVTPFRSDESVLDFREVYNGMETKCRISNLQSNTNYQIKVKAENRYGSSPWSGAFCFSTDAIRVIKALVNLKAEQIDATSVKLTWMDQRQNKEEEEGVNFTVEYSMATGGVNRKWSRCWTGTGTNCVVRDLSPSTEYVFRVFDAQQGQSTSKEITLQTQLAPPSTPRNLKIVQITNSSINIEWEGSRVSQRPKQSSLVDHYKIQITKSQQSSNSVPLSFTTVDKCFKIGSLESNQDYEIQLAAENDAGMSPWSHKVQIKTDLAPPLPPNEIQAQLMESGNEIRLEISWSLNFDHEKDFYEPRKFEVEIFGVGVVGKKSRNIRNLVSRITTSNAETNNLCSYSGLIRNQKYELKIRGVSSSGTPGKWSKLIPFNTLGLPEKEEKNSPSSTLDAEEEGGPSVSEATTTVQYKRLKKGQVLVPNKRTNPFKRRKTSWKNLKSYFATLVVFSLFLFVFALIYFNLAN
eukprot:g6380.t1